MTLCLFCLKMIVFKVISKLSNFNFLTRLSSSASNANIVNLTGITAFNSISKCKTQIATKTPNILTWYVCGPTVYDSSHIGHAWSYVNFDIMRRIMENYFDINVVQVMNITDIDDKIINKAKLLNISYKEVALKNELEFLQCLFQLNVRKPTLMTRATEYIPQILAFIDRMLQKNLAYQTNDGSVYFDVAAYTQSYKYGKFKPAEPFKTDSTSQKHLVNDFALWKGTKYEWEPSWDTPWGTKGRPGWHIECSVMASSVFGSSLDVHSGGIDLMYPHHENEEAQCCAYHEKEQWVGHWIHTKHLIINNGEKMSKSLNNAISIESFLKDHTADQFRMFCMLSHYRNEMEYSEETLDLAKETLKVVQNFLAECDAFFKNSSTGNPPVDKALFHKLRETADGVKNHLADDFNTAQATRMVRNLMSDTIKEIHSKADTPSVETIAAISNFVTNYFVSLGFFKTDSNTSTNDIQLKTIVEDINEFRSQVRNYALGMSKDNITPKKSLLSLCDNLRKNLEIKGIKIKDQSNKKSTWSWEN